MRFGVNLRSDLAKLDDFEIAAHYEKLIAEKVGMIQELPEFAKYKLFRWLAAMLTGRGLFHAPRFYKMQAFVIGALLSVGGSSPIIDANFLDHYLVECELKDVRDEIRRRVGLLQV
ncbi:hypothetical protein [Tardiphaga sp. 813_E8_N1_3]|uniref:hypothetical protein n=1 Tax=Tardiphaga sp. 813_E8_N1_3 TaxID=3240760 RepID=UPI003F22D911